MQFLPSPFQLHLYAVVVTETVFAFMCLRRVMVTFAATRRGADEARKKRRQYAIASTLLVEIQVAELVSLVGVCSTNMMLLEQVNELQYGQVLQRNAELLTWFAIVLVVYRLAVSLGIMFFETQYWNAMLLIGPLRYVGAIMMCFDALGHTIQAVFLSFYVTVSDKPLFGILFLVAVVSFRVVERGAMTYGKRMVDARNKEKS